MQFIWVLLKNKYVSAAVLLLIIAGGTWVWINRTQSTIEDLNNENAQLQVLNQSYENELAYKQERINRIREDYERQTRENKRLRENYVEAEQYSKDLREKLQEHDLTYLALEKPGLIQNRINKATEALFDELETIGEKPKSSDTD